MFGRFAELLWRGSGGSDDLRGGDVEAFRGRVELRLDLEVGFVRLGQNGVVQFGAGGGQRFERRVHLLLPRQAVDDVVEGVGDGLGHDGQLLLVVGILGVLNGGLRVENEVQRLVQDVVGAVEEGELRLGVGERDGKGER